MALFFSGPIENRRREIKSLVVRASNEGTEPANVRLEVFHAPQPNQGASAKVRYVQRLVSLDPGNVQTFDDIFADLPVVDVRTTVTSLGEDTTSVSFTARDARGGDLPGRIQPTDPILPTDPVQPALFTTAPIENRGRTIKSLVVRASNESVEPVIAQLEVFHIPQAGDGPSGKVRYVNQLVSIDPGTMQTFDNLYADLPVIEARVSVSGPEPRLTAVSFAARDAAGNELSGVIAPRAPVSPSESQ